MPGPHFDTRRIVVVDARPDDYVATASLVDAGVLDLRFLPNGRSALRLPLSPAADLWVVNTSLADMTGFDLVEMLRSRLGEAPLFMVGNSYDPDEERRALTLGVTRYLCKPIDASWLVAAEPGLRQEAAATPILPRASPPERAPLHGTRLLAAWRPTWEGSIDRGIFGTRRMKERPM